MRYQVCLFLLATLFTSLAAQDSGWAISASFAPKLDQRIKPIGYWQEYGPDSPPTGVTAKFFTDTLTVDGTERFFFRTGGLTFQPIAKNDWFGASVHAHRQLGRGFAISAGFFFNRADYTSEAAGPLEYIRSQAPSAPIMYAVHEVADRTLGGALEGTYHLFPARKLHPYFGMGVTLAHRKTSQVLQGVRYDGAPAVVEGLGSLDFNRAFTRFDFVVVGGVLYRLAPRWSVGLVYRSYTGFGQGAAGLQLRAHL